MIRIRNVQDLWRAMADLRAMSMLTQKALAEHIGVASGRIGDFERGRRTPFIPTVIRLLAVMGWQIALVPLEDEA